ncbi:MAG: hypothetical protein CVU49_05175 [Candidatus Cloacimonetes bacterium HGW-Cloacimonetes-2]|jgi:hypothetical protein|nr:MAG: hypothetical protein CVU49_05175 [Candidatus Cloacimonetes bacterium HGW-Cloacimonetes-2]
MKKLLLALIATSILLSLGAVDNKFLNLITHVKNSQAMSIMAENQQVYVRNNNQIWIYSSFNAWQPRIEASFYSVFPIEDINVAADRYLYICSAEPTNTVVPVDSLNLYGRIFFPTTFIGDRITREGATIYIADRYRGIDIIDIGSGGQRDIRSTFSEKWGIKDFHAEYPYLYALNDFGLVTVDITDLQFPTSMGTNYQIYDARVLAKNNDIIWIGAGKNLMAMSIRDLNNPTLINQYRFTHDILDIEVKDNRLFVALGPGGMRIMDVSLPTRIQEVNSILPVATVYDVALDQDYIFLGLGRDGWMIYQYH